MALPEKRKIEHLGDGVYAEFDGLGIWLRANDHRPELATDKIYLEPEVIRALNRFYDYVGGA